VRNDADTESPAPVLTVDTLPEDWAVESWSGTDAAYRNSTNEWLWTTVGPGETVKFTVTVSLSADASGEKTIGMALTDGDDRTATADATITVSEPDNTTDDAGGDADRSIPLEVPGFGFQVALTAILVTSGILASDQVAQ
jgi:hypothetical protein